MNFRQAFLQFLAAQLLLSTAAQGHMAIERAPANDADNKKEADAVDAQASKVPELKVNMVTLEQQSDEQIVQISNSLWNQVKKELDRTKISNSFDAIPVAELGRGYDLGLGLKFQSYRNVPGKFAGIDVWDFTAKASNDIFGSGNSKGLSAGRKLTFMRQFDTRKQSLLRLPYDPITKVPTTSKRLLREIKAGNFVGFRAPMTLNLGDDFSKDLSKQLGFAAGLSLVISGEFDIQVFRMDNNQVRVKIMAINETAVKFRTSILGLNSAGNIIIEKILDTEQFSLYLSRVKTDQFLGDYIFNMNSEEAKEIYDNQIGSKMKFLSFDNIKEQLKIAVSSGDKNQKKMVSDLKQINEISYADLQKPVSERRIMRVSNLRNESVLDEGGIKIDIIRLLKFRASENKIGSKINLFLEDGKNTAVKYLIDGVSSNKYYEFLLNWGQRDERTASAILKADNNYNPSGFLGMQFTKRNIDLKMNPSSFKKAQANLMANLPQQIGSEIKWPEMNKTSRTIIHQDILFNENLFNLNLGVTSEQVQAAIVSAIENSDVLNSAPAESGNTGMYGEGASEDSRLKAFRDAATAAAHGSEKERVALYLAAYKDFDMAYMAHHIPIVLNTGYAMETRINSFKYITEKIPLFNEIGAAILLKFIPASELKKTVLSRTIVSVRGQDSSVNDYPSIETYNQQNLFRALITQNLYNSNRSYSMRDYVKTDGTNFTAEEILSTSPTSQK